MSEDIKKPSPERLQTDESLRDERANADRTLAQRAAVEEDADAVVERARANADAVLDVARERADQAAPDAPAAVAVETAQERELEDRVLREERAAADARLLREREEEARTLSALLPLERDKTDRFLLTERIRSDHAVASRDDFLGIVSHDLRNLLSGIVTSAALLAKTASDADGAAKTLIGAQRITRYAARMNRLIGDLVDVASIDAGALAFTPVPGDIAALIAEAVDSFHAAAEASGLSLTIAPLPRAATFGADFDHDRMLQVLANLLSNALKFTARGGAITLGVESHDEGLRVWVRDTGAGVPETMLESIFERFWQVGKNDRRGVGLGLYISKCIVEAHGGRIWAESKIDEGSTFSFTLPSSSGRAA